MRVAPDPDDVDEVVRLLTEAARPVLVLGGDVWAGGAESAALRFVETLGLPVIANGMGRGVVPAGHRLLVTRARGAAFGGADLVVVIGTPLDFRLGYGAFGDAAAPARVVHLVDSPEQVARHASLAASASGDLGLVLDALTDGVEHLLRRPSYDDWATDLRARADAASAKDAADLGSDADPVHPARIYGELLPRLADDAVVIGDGGDFVSYADTLVRHALPVVMVVGNNGMWGLEKHPMQFLYQYDVAAELRPGTRYDDVVKALGGDGETVTAPGEIGAALDRAFASGVPYLVNVLTDPAIAYPRNTTGI